jgi:3'(2'), 5'-bisphosphate nucleotidase
MLSKNQIQDLIDLSKKAGDEIMEIYNNFDDKDISYKNDNSPLTTADKKANEIICEFLVKNYPEFSILSEENNNQNLKETQYFWVVDPLDGTREFIKRNGEFTVNIGLCKNNIPVAGFIYAPFFKQMYCGVKDLGAFYLESNSDFKISNFSKISVSNRVNNLIMVGSKSHQSTGEKELYEKNKDRISQIKKVGSSLKGCLIAKGDADIYYRFGLTSKWDVCAMQVICEEAGATVKQLDDSEIEYKLNQEDYLNKKGFYIVNSPLKF